MIINKHELVHADDAGNGYHGRCKHCGRSLVTDLGYCSWDNTTCKDREIEDEIDIPEDVKSLASFCGYRWNDKLKIYIKASFSKDLDHKTVDEMKKQLDDLKIKCN